MIVEDDDDDDARVYYSNTNHQREIHVQLTYTCNNARGECNFVKKIKASTPVVQVLLFRWKPPECDIP